MGIAGNLFHSRRYHHTPEQLPEEKQSYRAIVDIVHVANVMCLILGFGLGADGLQHNISEEALERFNLKIKLRSCYRAVNILYQLDEEMKTERSYEKM